MRPPPARRLPLALLLVACSTVIPGEMQDPAEGSLAGPAAVLGEAPSAAVVELVRVARGEPIDEALDAAARLEELSYAEDGCVKRIEMVDGPEIIASGCRDADGTWYDGALAIEGSHSAGRHYRFSELRIARDEGELRISGALEVEPAGRTRVQHADLVLWSEGGEVELLGSRRCRRDRCRWTDGSLYLDGVGVASIREPEHGMVWMEGRDHLAVHLAESDKGCMPVLREGHPEERVCL